jgi:SAM-dependent methyltransferase
MSDIMYEMPSPVENGMMIPTLDRQGWIWLYKDEVTESYIRFSSETKGLMVEIGAGYGHIVLDVLKNSAHMIAVDVSQEQLDIIKYRATHNKLSGLEVIKAEFPEELDLPTATIDGVLISRLFHFFNGQRIRASIKKIHSCLKTGGKIFIVADSVYRTIFKELIPQYEKNVSDGLEWPGLIDDVRKYIPKDRLNPNMQPLSMNFTDPEIWQRELKQAGFIVEKSSFFKYPADPDYARLDGREIVGAIGVKK